MKLNPLVPDDVPRPVPETALIFTPGLLILLIPSGEKEEAKEGFSRIQTLTVPSAPYITKESSME